MRAAAERILRQARRWAHGAGHLAGTTRCYLGNLPGSPSSSHPPGGMRRLALFPAGDEEVASTRLRLLPLVGLLEPDSVRAVTGTARVLRYMPDVAWFQKRLTTRHLNLARQLKERGGVILYDCDDSGPDLDWWARSELVREMLLLADAVLTETPERAEILKEIEPSCQPRVVENQADYGGGCAADETPTERSGNGLLRVLWFGNEVNLKALSGYRRVLAGTRGVRLVVCGARRREIRRVFGALPVEVRRWSWEGFPEVLGSCHVTLLSHFGSHHDAAKSAHKMVTSICHGVPVLVSSTPDYQRVAAFSGVEAEAVYASPQELGRLLEAMKSPELRRAYIDRSRPRLRARYAYGAFSTAAIRVVNEVAGWPAPPGRDGGSPAAASPRG